MPDLVPLNAAGRFVRRWGVTVYQNARWVPMVSLGVHIDWHTPLIDLHLPLVTISIGRTLYEIGPRVVVNRAEPWAGHTDMCSCSELDS